MLVIKSFDLSNLLFNETNASDVFARKTLITAVNRFLVNVSILYLVVWGFQGIQVRNIGQKWVNVILTTPDKNTTCKNCYSFVLKYLHCVNEAQKVIT